MNFLELLYDCYYLIAYNLISMSITCNTLLFVYCMGCNLVEIYVLNFQNWNMINKLVFLEVFFVLVVTETVIVHPFFGNFVNFPE